MTRCGNSFATDLVASANTASSPNNSRSTHFKLIILIAEKHGGPSLESNLAWSCFYYNTYKGPNVAGWFAETDQIVRLYNPRKDRWSEHFEWNGPVLRGRTQIGIVTIDVLRINHPDALAVRRVLADV